MREELALRPLTLEVIVVRDDTALDTGNNSPPGRFVDWYPCPELGYKSTGTSRDGRFIGEEATFIVADRFSLLEAETPESPDDDPTLEDPSEVNLDDETLGGIDSSWVQGWRKP